MTAATKKALREYFSSKTDEYVEKSYYIVLRDCLGSVSERMIEEDYCARDIQERKDYEDFCQEEAELLEEICCERGIKLFDRKERENNA